jgi:plastocyanin
MKIPRPLALVLVLALIATSASLLACNDSNNNNGGVLNPPAKELDSGNILNGGNFQHTFANVGTFNYHCTIHGTGMAGSVIVVSGAPATATVEISNNKYTPVSVSVGPGGQVTWSNIGVTHTVTSN